jgi:DNA-binding SARP family transcriptional activator
MGEGLLTVRMEFCLLGPLVVRCGGMDVEVAGGKLRAVLAALLLNAGRVVPLEELTDTLWGSEPPPSAQVAVRNHMKRLRHALGEPGQARISTGRGGYLISVQAGELDVSRFEDTLSRARAAVGAGEWERAADLARESLSLWRGEPLADVGSELLALREVPRLAETRLQALELRIDADLQLGRHADVIAELRSLTAAHPLREHLHGQRMLALYQCGRQAEALAAYQDVRRVLVDELGAEPGIALRSLHQQILTGIPVRPGPAPDRPSYPNGGSPPGRVRATDGKAADVVPRQLPAVTAHFIGRTAELDVLARLARKCAGSGGQAAVISAIGGTPGVGKTALAVHWAHQVAGRFPGGQLFVNLRGFDPMGIPVPPADALRDLLGALGLPAERIPPGLDARAALYRSLLWGRRMLVVLDNARDAAQVRPLLPGGPGCLVVVTSRSTLAGLAATEGARLLTLGLLPAAEARELLARRLGAARLDAEPAAATELARVCGGLPLALSVAAARVSAFPRLQLRALTGELTDARSRLDALDTGDATASVRAVFSWSMSGLSAAAARLFLLLGLHPGPDIATPAAASLAGVPLPEARHTLRELAHAHLIIEHAPGRFSVHDLLRSYAAEQAAASGGTIGARAAVHRMLDHYLHTSDAANRILYPTRVPLVMPVPQPGARPEALTDAGQAQAWLQAERRALVAAAHQAADLGFDRHAWQIPFCLMMFLGLQSYRDERAAVQGSALAAARRLGDLAAQARIHIGSAHACMSAGLAQDAFGHLGNALRLYRQLGDRAGCARAHVAFSLVLNRLGRHREAFSDAQQSLVLAWSAGSWPDMAHALNATGWTYAHLGNLHRAKTCCQLAFSLHQETGNRLGQAETLDSLGYICQELGDYGQAVSFYQRALSILRALASRHEEAITRTRLGDAHLTAGHPRKARRAWQRALAAFAEENHPNADCVLRKLQDLRHPASDTAREQGRQPVTARTSMLT